MRNYGKNMDIKTTFIGHRNVCTDIVRDKLKKVIEDEIKNGCVHFIVGSHGNFDRMALSVCKELKNKYQNLIIEVVITSLNSIKKHIEYDMFGKIVYEPYENVNTIMYEIEQEYFKKQIIVSNKKMIEECDLLICHVDTSRVRSGAKIAYNYAKKLGKRIINLYTTTIQQNSPFN